jgi:DNA-binding transcriptional regulator YhcF (GntR family)
LQGTRVMLIAPQHLQPHHRILTTEETARRLNLKHQTESRGLRKLWQWLVD